MCGVWLPWWLSSKESTCNAENLCSITELGILPGEGNGNPLQYSCLGNPMDIGAWWATVHGVAKESGMTEGLNNNNIYGATVSLYCVEMY